MQGKWHNILFLTGRASGYVADGAKLRVRKPVAFVWQMATSDPQMAAHSRVHSFVPSGKSLPLSSLGTHSQDRPQGAEDSPWRDHGGALVVDVHLVAVPFAAPFVARPVCAWVTKNTLFDRSVWLVPWIEGVLLQEVGRNARSA